MDPLSPLTRLPLMDVLLRASATTGTVRELPGGIQNYGLLGTQASQTSLSLLTEDLLQVLKDYFPSPELRYQQLSPLMRFAQQTPALLAPMVRILGWLKHQNASEETLSRSVRLLSDLSQKIPNDSSPGTRLGGEQQVGQWMQQLEKMIVSQPHLPPTQRLNPQALIQFLSFALQESPDTFENEIFASAVHQQAGFTLTEYQTLAHHVEPIRSSLLLIAAQKQGCLPELVAQLKEAIKDQKPLLPLVTQWEQRLQPAQPKSLRDISLPIHTLQEGIAQVPQGDEQALLLQALSVKSGLLPDSSWQVGQIGLNPVQYGLIGSLFMTAGFPQGLHRLRFRVSDQDGEESLADFFLYAVQGILEEEDEKSEHQRKHRESQYDPVTLSPEPASPPSRVGGTIAVRLKTPFILTKPYDRDKTIPAPLQMSFHFLADIVDPKTLFSRKDFLTFSSSPEIEAFRKSVRNLGTKGMAAYDPYLKSLERLFQKLGKTIPFAKESLKHAQHFLRDEVLLYLMRKKDLSLVVPESGFSLKMTESSDRGDLIASLCGTTADLLVDSGQIGEALIEFADAATLARNKPCFLQKLDGFFQHLRGRPLQQPLASQFVSNLKILAEKTIPSF